ncbi:CBS domain protein [Methanohalophilus euhalobius]|jgi:CBS domain-containing protein|uniref:CBS domain protein n=1 Tax=Methanohalophilus euhalobius TaxID=51203 RepID=A0A285G608_9EURY|nr:MULTISPECIES: CBS domain-containing protein [Methanohalophilus]ODV49755.1 MAG: hypothetical protein A8273_1023 [Methanohalophilus sp. 2-GBenrich]RSD35422.1 MAG: hypothetical protein CI952_1004 [Methanohalophilus sp.]TCL12063.1 CBS domain protein [Methanohalophilus euhalobius]SNY18544.1 CBS domain-containing protein [Methanohalophilus euhalobius]
MNVSDIMSTPVYVIGTEEPVSHARNLMFRHKISTLIVVEEEEIKGIITKSDISSRLAQAEPMWRRRPIDKIPAKIVMTAEPIITIYPDASVSQAINLMLENQINNLPVFKNKLQGIVTIGDVVRYVADKAITTKISEMLTDDSVEVHRHHTINHVIDEMEKHRVSKVIVINDVGDSVGMISTRDIALSAMEDNEGKMQSKNIKMARKPTQGGEKTYRYVKDVPLVAEDIMVELDGVVNIEDNLSDAAKVMVENNRTGLPVEKEGKIVGILSRIDIIRAA